MVEKIKKSQSLIKQLKSGILTLIILAAILLVAIIVVGIVYLNTRTTVLLAILIFCSGTFAAVVISGLIYLLRYTDRHFIQNIWKVSQQNLSAVKNDSYQLEKFHNTDYVEYEEMNKLLGELESHNRNITVVNTQFNYSKISLEYVDAVKHIITYDSLKKHIRDIVYCSQSYRNVLVSVYYEISGDEIITAEENERIINIINEIFDYDNVLIAKNKSEYLIYIPSIDSSTQLIDEFEMLTSRTCITKQRADGNAIIVGKINAVVYPFSEIDELFIDLEYAKTQENEGPIYFPEKENRDPNHSLLQTTMNLNAINKSIYLIDNLKLKKYNLEEDLKGVEKILAKLSAYVNVDECGLILWNKNLNCYISYLKINITEGDVTPFIQKKRVDNRITDAFSVIVEKNNAFYFSSRKRVGAKLGEISDLLGVSSGFIYKIDGDEFPIGYIYYVNKNEKQLKLDSYLYESLTVISALVGSHMRQFYITNQIRDYRQREEEALKLSNLFSYSIDKDTFKITDFSQSFKDTFGDVEKGDTCFKKLHGLDAPCPNCPLRTGNKMTSSIKFTKYETSLYLAATEDVKIADLLMSELESSLDSSARYDKDYLVKSGYAFANRLRDLFYTNSKGYILVLMIDNASDLVEKLGTEGYANYMRKFTKTISNKVENSGDIYLFQDDALAILYPEMGRMEIISRIEKIYDISKENLLGLDVEAEFKIAYDAVKYPQSFASSNDIINYMNKNIYNRNKTLFRSDLLHIDESDYYRQASRKEYILSILDDSVHNKTFNVKLQPMIRDFDKAITGAELLIRLSDIYKESMISTNELIQVAADNNKIGAISDFLMNYIGDLYNKFGHNVFKTHGFTRLSLNTDYSYFTDKHFFDKVATLKNNTYLPKNFLAFEINEREVYEHADRFTAIFEGIKRADIALVCDQYTGAYLSIEKLNQIGFTEIKVDRSMVKDIENNDGKFNNIRMIIANAIAYDMKTCLVGIENKDQYLLIKNDQCNTHLQGYYFYKPLDILELMEAVRADNN